METFDIWDKFYIHRKKIAIAFCLVCLFFSAEAQRNTAMNNPNYDNRKFSYGFLIGVHTSRYVLKYSDKFISNALDTVHSILPIYSPGFSLGFIVNHRITEFFDVRVLPKVSFYEHLLEYNYTNDAQTLLLKESTIIELPLMLKYKSARRGNSRMYVVGGMKPAISASGKGDKDSEFNNINIQRGNISADLGFGFDIYFPLFKFSPELRISKGLSNMLSSKTNKYSEGISRLSTSTFNFYLLFQ